MFGVYLLMGDTIQLFTFLFSNNKKVFVSVETKLLYC